MAVHASIERMLTISFVTGTEPGKWFKRYEELSGTCLSTLPSTNPLAEPADLALLRLPDARVDDSYHVVRLYEEALGVAVPKDSVYAEMFAATGEAVDIEDLRDEIVNFDFFECLKPAGEAAGETVGDAIEQLQGALQVVAANVGVAYGPLPLLRALSKKQVAAVELRAPEVAPTQIALVWEKERDSDEVQDFVGVAKGRTVRSSRQTATPKKPGKSQVKDRSAKGGKKTVQHRRMRKRKRR
ncbi:LysR substrate-binding domain-containing protein [Corynebacterium sp. HMSC29G08]|uniref:LysR substrate-binding domain-containing protein n=1 Tax=Corynebacterium sp. HMSC29G08 TaxID=1581069 RepID=UPI001FEE2635|nr:LysR substrate-binding domain-containing protein [Corynebacterium sp. HMSC29G08]